MFWKFMFHGGNGLQPMAPTNKHMSALVKKNNFAWKLLTSFGCFFSTNNDEILPNQTQGCSQKKAHFSTVCTLHRVLTMIMPVKPMIPMTKMVRCEKELPAPLARNLSLPAPSLPPDAQWWAMMDNHLWESFFFVTVMGLRRPVKIILSRNCPLTLFSIKWFLLQGTPHLRPWAWRLMCKERKKKNI